MKKFFIVSLALILVLYLATPALAVTPDLDVPDMPEIPDIGDDIDFGIDFGGIIDGWLEENPVPPLVPTEPVEEPSAPAELTEPVEVPTEPVGWFSWIQSWFWWMK